jgi:hypothetical protein
VTDQTHKITYWIIFAVVFPFTLYGANQIDSGGPCTAGIVMAFTMMAAMICSGLLSISFLVLKPGERGKTILSIVLSLSSLTIWTILFYGIVSDEGVKVLVFLGEFEILCIWTVVVGFMKMHKKEKSSDRVKRSGVYFRSRFVSLPFKKVTLHTFNQNKPT